MTVISEPILAELHRYWRVKRGTDGTPDRAAIDPVDIPRLLPHFYMLDIGTDSHRATFRFRIVGTAIVARLGFDPTGSHVHDVVSDTYLDYMERLFRKTIDTREAIYSRSDYKYPPKTFLTVSRLILPLSGADAQIEHLIVGQIFDFESQFNESDYNAVIRQRENSEVEHVMEEFSVSDA